MTFISNFKTLNNHQETRSSMSYSAKNDLCKAKFKATSKKSYTSVLRETLNEEELLNIFSFKQESMTHKMQQFLFSEAGSIFLKKRSLFSRRNPED